MARPVIIDTDPGIDDAVAILLALASPEIDVRALVAVTGNLPLTATARNALRVLELAGRREIPVFAGCPRPLGRPRRGAAEAHGDLGLGDLVLPEPANAARPEHGVVHLIETLRAAPPRGVTLCALGPLTNIATALAMAPDIAAAIAELVVMGGGGHGNITAAAEFNIHCDPEAAALVFDAGLPVTLVPLDATERVLGTPERLAPLRRLGTRCGTAVATLTGPREWSGQPPMAMHDPCVIAYLVAPELCRVADAHVAVETGGALTRGMTVIDRRGRRAANARVVEAVDPDGFYRLLAERVARLP